VLPSNPTKTKQSVQLSFHEQQCLLHYSNRFQSEPFKGFPVSREHGKESGWALRDGVQSRIPCIEKLMEELGVQGILTWGLCCAV